MKASRHDDRGTLPIPVREVLREPLDEAAIDAAYRRRRASPAPRASWWRAPLAAAALSSVAIAAAAALAIYPASSAPGPLMLSDQSAPSVFLGGARARFEDGSSLVVGEGAHAVVLENDARVFALLLERGRVEVEVEPGGPRRWTLEAGIATISVVGTRFVVDRRVDHVEVEVLRGVVVVRGPDVPDGARRLEAGERLSVRARRAAPAARAEAPRAPDVALASPQAASPQATLPQAEPPPLEEPAIETGRRRPQWRSLAAQGAYADAFGALGDEGVAAETRLASVEDLFTLADVARLSGHPAAAVAPLSRILNEHSSDARAPLAAFTLGRVEADALSHHGRAAAAFDRAIALGLPGDLVPDALARSARAHQRAGDLVRARQSASRYLRDYAQGPAAESMRTLVEVD